MIVMQAVLEGVKRLPERDPWPASVLVQLADADQFERFAFVGDATVGDQLASVPAGAVVRVELSLRRAKVEMAGAFYKARILSAVAIGDGATGPQAA
jgi:hypothetical protein